MSRAVHSCMILTTVVPTLLIAFFVATLATSYVTYVRVVEVVEYLS